VRKSSATRVFLLTATLVAVLVSIALVTLKVGPGSDRDGPEDKIRRAYAFTLLYTILHDDSHGPLPRREL